MFIIETWRAKRKEENDDEFASDYEKYCSLRTKALFKAAKFHECKELSDLALKRTQQVSLQ